MEGVLIWIFWAAMIGISIASSAKKAKKKREEEARKAAAKAAASRTATTRTTQQTVARQTPAGQSSGTSWGTGAGMAGQGSNPAAGGAFGRVLEELSRQLNEQPSPTVAEGRKPTISWPVTSSQSAATSEDYYSLEEEYDEAHSVETLEDEVTAYERLADQRARRSSLAAATVPGSVAGSGVAAAAGVAAQDLSADRAADTRSITLQELLGGDFDLRRAVIEAEILNPKYVSGAGEGFGRSAISA